MLISLIIPMYNVENYISACLQSVMNQTYSNFECIIVNDKSPDRSEEFANQMISNYKGGISFHIISHDSNKGLPNALNTGIINSRGDYLFFLDSDDTITSDCVGTMVGLLACNKRVDLIQCGVNDQYHHIFDLSKLPVYCETRELVFRYFLKMYIPWTVHAKLVRKQFLMDNSLFFNQEILIHEDLYWSYFVCQKCKSFISSTKVVYNYNTSNPGSIMHQSEQCFERSAHYYLIIMDRLLSSIDKANLADNRLFLDNLFLYLGTTIEKSKDITLSTYKTYKGLRFRFWKTAWYHRNLAEVLYLWHLYNPLKFFLRFSFYRNKLYLLEKIIRWEYEKN